MPHNWLITGDDGHGDLVEISLDGPALDAAMAMHRPGAGSFSRTGISRGDAVRIVSLIPWDAGWGPHPVGMIDHAAREWHVETQRLHAMR